MSVVAYRDGIMCSDSGAYGNDVYLHEVPKIIKVKNRLCGGTGSITSIYKFLNWCQSYSTLKLSEFTHSEYPELQAVIVDRQNDIEKIYYLSDTGYYEIKADYYAEGAGYQVALGAFTLGATARQAVEAAIKHHTKCSGSIQEIKF